MSAVAHHDHHDDHHELHNPMEPTRKEQIRMNRMGLWMFCLSEAFLFFAILAARFYLWRDADGAAIRPYLEQGPALAFTVVLLLSSYFMNRAEVAIANDDKKTFSFGMLMTAGLGLVFLLGVIFVEWGLMLPEPHLPVNGGAFAAVFYAMTGMHAIHVVTGVILILIVWNNGRKGLYDSKEHWAVEACAIYWHYVDLVWVFFYPAIYLIGYAVKVPHHSAIISFFM